MFATVFGEIKGLLKADFWLGSFLPVAIVAFLHALIYAILFPTVLSVDALFDLSAGEAVGRGAVLLLLLIALAYVVTPLVTLFHGLLDGSLLPPPLHSFLHWIRTDEWTKLERALKARANRMSKAKKLRDDSITTFPDARQRGNGKPVADPGAIRTAIAMVNRAKRSGIRLWCSKLDRAGLLEDAGGALKTALSANTTDPALARSTAEEWARRLEGAVNAFAVLSGTDRLVAAAQGGKAEPESWNSVAIEQAEAAIATYDTGRNDANKADADKALRDALDRHRLSPAAAERLARELDALQSELRRLLDQYAAHEEYLYEIATRRTPTFDLNMAEATRLGDARRGMERYSRAAYGVKFDWLWPRLELLISGDAGLPVRLSDSKRQLDFATLLLASIQTVPSVWLIVIFMLGGPLWLALLIGATWPLLNAGLYEGVVRAQMALGRIVEAAIDEHRFELIDQLKLPRPPTLLAERTLWDQLARVESRGRDLNIRYSHDAPGTVE